MEFTERVLVKLGVVDAKVSSGTGQAQKRPRTDAWWEQAVGRRPQRREKQPRRGGPRGLRAVINADVPQAGAKHERRTRAEDSACRPHPAAETRQSLLIPSFPGHTSTSTYSVLSPGGLAAWGPPRAGRGEGTGGWRHWGGRWHGLRSTTCSGAGMSGLLWGTLRSELILQTGRGQGGEEGYRAVGHVCVSHSAVSDSATPWTVAHQAPRSMGLSRPEYCSG